MKRIYLTAIAAITAYALAWSVAGAQAPWHAPTPTATSAVAPGVVSPVVSVEDPLSPTVAASVAAELHAHGVVVSVRRYAGQSDAPEATTRIAQAFAALLKAHGVQAWPDGSATEPGFDHPASIEIDPTFYVYTQKFNAQRVRLPAYVAARLHEARETHETPDTRDAPNTSAASSVAASEPTPDVLRVAAGALGLVTGFLSPSHGAYMIATGSRVSNTLNEHTAALFGAGPAPTRLFGSHLERYQRGEQEALVGVRVRTGTIDERIVVKATAPGDDPPFALDALTAAAWQGAIEQLAGQPSIHLPAHETRP